MKWYAGDIASAINDCKRDGALLLVYIKGADDVTEQMDMVWQDSEVSRLFDDGKSVCLQLPSRSVGGQQFSQIYPVSEVPSTYFIRADGQVADVIRGPCTKEQLTERASKILHLSPPTQTAQSSSAGAQAMANADVQEETEEEIRGNTEYTPEEKEKKIQRARELIKMKQEKKAAEEKEKAKNAEMERRQLGRDLNKLKEMKAQQEAKETRDALRKEKEETRLAREKIRAQIQRDREARHAKFQQEKSEKEEALRQKQKEKLEREAEEAARVAAENSSSARIQFRLPDGSKINHLFEADETLQAARDVVASHEMNSLGRDFRLATIYPRRVFTAEDNNSTLRDLTLVPSSALMVLPPATGGDRVVPSSSATGSVTTLFSFLLSPFIVIWNFIQAFLFARPENPPVQQTPPSTDKSNRSTASGESTSGSNSGTTPRRRVGRLSDMPPDGDDQNTWNGNSTQQM